MSERRHESNPPTSALRLREQLSQLARDIGTVAAVADRRTIFDKPHEERDHQQMLRTLGEWRSRVLALLPPAEERDDAMCAVALREWARLIRLAETQQELFEIADEIDVNAKALEGDEPERDPVAAFDALVGSSPELATPSLPPAGEWQPIETAPKDGTRILALDGHSHVIVAWEACYSDKTIQRFEDSGGFERHVTLWMPLPPSQAEAREK